MITKPPKHNFTPVVSIRIPTGLIQDLDAMAAMLGVNRTIIIKMALQVGCPAVKKMISRGKSK